MEALLVRPDRSIESVRPENGKDFKLKELYKLIGCDSIEVVYYDKLIGGKEYIIIIDEEGKFKILPINYIVTSFWGKPQHLQDFIVGNAIICPKEMLL